MTAVGDAVSKIKEVQGIDNVYPFFIPENKASATNTTDCFVSDMSNDPMVFGSDRLMATDQHIAVHIFYKLKIKGVDELNYRLISTLESDRWRYQAGNGFSQDPDTKQPTTILYFRRKKTWN